MSKVLFVSVADFEEEAKNVIGKDDLSYFRTGSLSECTLRLNAEAYERFRIRPRFLRDISHRETNVDILGLHLSTPIGVSPTAMHKIAHPDGELATARAAGKMGSVYILSSLSTTSIEEIAAGAPNTHKWLQIYIYRDRTLTESLIRRAERVGFKALVLTIDSPRGGLRRSTIKSGYRLPSHLKFANFINEFNKKRGHIKDTSDINHYVSSQFDSSVTWKDLEWLVNFTTLPVVLKGVLTKEDALLAHHYGCSGILVSNHGGRQLDCVPATIEALPEIVKAVGNKIPVMVDGGITQGTDVFKALALGAKMVFLGRAIIWGLAVNGQAGVEDVLNIVRKEFELTMDLAGCVSLSNITRDKVVHESYYNQCHCKL